MSYTDQLKSKKGNRYVIEDYDVSTKDNLLDMPLDAVISSVFFYHLGKDLSVVMNRFLERELSKIPSHQEQDLMLNGDGIKQFSHSKGDLRRFENITKLKAHECLLMLEYMKEKNELEASKIKRNLKDEQSGNKRFLPINRNY